MSILDLQRRMREIGRIRTGIQVPKKGGGTRPSKLETFRLTSPTRELIDAAAETYGGEVQPWQSPAGPEWEVITKAAAIDIVVPPGQSFSQWYELWSGGGCQRRCDGETNVLTMTPCECPADPVERRELAQEGRACKPTSRLNVILPALPDLGVWRLESHGFYAAVELAGSADFLAMAMQAGRLLPARLRLDQREKKVPGKPTNRYAVPVIEFTQTRIADLLAAGAGDLPQLGAGGRSELPAAPALPERSTFRAPTASEAPGASEQGPQLPESARAGAGQGPQGDAEQEPSDPMLDDVDAAAEDLDFAAPQGDAAAADPKTLGAVEFMRLLGSTDGVTHELVVTAARRRYPSKPNLSALSDEERALLWDDVLAGIPSGAAR